MSDKRKSAYIWRLIINLSFPFERNISYFVNGFRLVGSVDKSDIVKEAVLFLQCQQVRLGTGGFWRYGAGQNNVQVTDRRLRRFSSSGLSFDREKKSQ